MSKAVVAVDIDEVVSSQIDVFVEFSKQTYGITLTGDDFQRPGEYWTYYETVLLNRGISEEEAKRGYNRFLTERVPLQQIITEDTKEALNYLKRKFHLEIVTSRSGDWQKDTLDWLAESASDIFRGVHFVELWDKNSERVTKGQICREIGAGYLIDDNLDHCNLADDLGVTALLFGRFGWNMEGRKNQSVIRVNNWPEVVRYFDDL